LLYALQDLVSDVMLNTFQMKILYFETYFAVMKKWFVNLLAN